MPGTRTPQAVRLFSRKIASVSPAPRRPPMKMNLMLSQALNIAAAVSTPVQIFTTSSKLTPESCCGAKNVASASGKQM